MIIQFIKDFWIAIVAVIALFIALVWAEESNGQTTACAPREHIVEKLDNDYGEVLKYRGILDTGLLLEVYASDETGTWTILVTSAEGLACVASVGENFEEIDEELGGQL